MQTSHESADEGRFNAKIHELIEGARDSVALVSDVGYKYVLNKKLTVQNVVTILNLQDISVVLKL